MSVQTSALQTNQTQQFTATVQGTGNFDSSVRWSVDGIQGGATTIGTISSAGLYTAPAVAPNPNMVAVRATSNADSSKSATAAVTITAATGVQVSIAPATLGMRPGASQQFRVTVTGSSNTMVTWSIREGSMGGTVSDAGAYTAPTTLGVYHVIATSVADTSKDATATVHVVESGSFTPTGSMGMGRVYHTATLLPNGKVLVAGGGSVLNQDLDVDLISAAAELYDPETGSFAPTGSMGTSRASYTATLLPGGKVLVAGGTKELNSFGFHVNTSTAELYDPATGSFISTGGMQGPRALHTATLLRNGKVLVTGGGNPSFSDIFATAELYDPDTGSFTPTGSMGTPRITHTATLLPNGKVLVTGGGNFSAPSATAELYDPDTGSFTPTGSMGTPRNGHTETLLSDGRVLITGGSSQPVAELYDPNTGSFAPTGSMEGPRARHTATLLPNGTVLVTGGGVTVIAEIYDPSTGRFSRTGSMVTVRVDPTATRLRNGKVLVVGGYDDPCLATAELYE